MGSTRLDYQINLAIAAYFAADTILEQPISAQKGTLEEQLDALTEMSYAIKWFRNSFQHTPEEITLLKRREEGINLRINELQELIDDQ